MARKRPNDVKAPSKVNVIDLGHSIGLTLMKDSSATVVSDWLPTSIPSLDYILGGGIPFGRVTEIYGKEQSGKSTLGVHLTKQAQMYDVPVIWVDIEGTINQESLASLGVDITKIFMVQPDEGTQLTIEMVTEKVDEIVNAFGGAGVPVMIIWDSLASTATNQQLKEGFNHNQMGVVAKAIANMTIQLGQKINQNNIAFIVLNQARDDLKANPMFPAIKSTGGRAMEHWGSLRLEVAKASQIKSKVVDPATGKDKDDYIGHVFRVKTKKSKVSTPNRQAEMFLISQPFIGFDFTENVYRSATDQYGLISKGAWREYITDDGEVIKLRDKDWVPFLNSTKGLPILREVFLKELLTYFPKGFAPLNNKNIDVSANPFFIGLEDIYEEVSVADAEALKAPKEAEEETPSE